MSAISTKKDSKLFYSLQALVDISLVCLGFTTAFLYYGFNMGISIIDTREFLNIIPVIALIALVYFKVYGVFKCGEKSLFETFLSVLISIVFINISAMALIFIFRFAIPRGIFVVAMAAQFVFLLVWKYIVHKMYPSFNKPKTAAVIGNGNEAVEIAKKIVSGNRCRYDVKHLFGEINDEIYDSIKDVDAVFLSSKLKSSAKEKIICHCLGLEKMIYVIPELFEISMFNADMKQFDDMPAFCIENLSLTIEQQFVKRAFDLIISGIFLILALPAMLLVIAAIKLQDGGPVLFQQERVTKDNKIFKLYKFRTMVVDAEKKTGPILAFSKDPRITRLGSFLRATRLDELPQLFNVLAGDMSFIGPRPERPFFVEQFKKDIPDFGYRVAVKAGITGLAQVKGKYTTSPQDKLRYDLFYIRNYSFLMDLKIMLQTVKIVFMKTSSSGVKEGALPEIINIDFNKKANKEFTLVNH